MPPPGSLAHGLLNRELGRTTNRGYASHQWLQGGLLSKVDFGAKPTIIPIPPAVETGGLPIVAKFNKNRSFSNCQLLAVGGEEGIVTIASTESTGALERGALDGSWRPRAHWPCHRNSIFDLAWAKNDSVLYTASGHQQVGVWDTDTARALAVAEGHEGSVKCISPQHLCEDVFMTGARDGRMMLWDARCPGFSGQTPAAGRRTQAGTDLDTVPVISPVWVQENAHTRPAVTSGRASTKIAKSPAVTVTSVAFLPYSYLLASSGAQDTVVKLWDLRMHGLPLCDLELPKAGGGAGGASGRKAKAADAGAKSLPHEVAEFTCPTRASAVGVTHLVVSESGDRLLVSCLDSQHHLFSLNRLASGPLATWRAPPPSFKGSFYMRSAFSPCGDYILCGSRDCGAHIWQAADPHRSPIELPHEREVTGVAWCGGDWSKVATCSDSGEVRLWTLTRLPAREARAEEASVPAMASHVAELEADGADADAEQRLLHRRQVKTAAAGQAEPSVPPASRPGAPARNPTIRRTVQLRLNLLRAPVPTPPAPAPATAVAPPAAPPASDRAAERVNTVPICAVMEAPSAAAAAVHAAIVKDSSMFLSLPGGTRGQLDGKPVAVRAADVRATALASPVSSGPAYPALITGPASVRRASMLPPVPIFSPAVNCWQHQPPRTELDCGGAPAAAATPLEAARSGAVAAFACGGLEAAMKGLAHVRTQSPARAAARCGEFDSEPSGQSPLPPPNMQAAELHQSQSFPPPASSALPAARAPAVSPRTTPASFNRSRSRLGPFSPSRSSIMGSGSGPFSSGQSNGGHSNGGAGGTPKAHQAPQGVVDQILRNSPRHSSRTGHAGVGMDAMLSPRYGCASAEGLAGDAAEASVQRRLFGAADGEAENAQLRGGAAAATMQGAGAGQSSPRLGLGSGADIVTAVDGLLQHPGLQSPGGSVAARAYDLQDGTDVAPALRYRAAHPDDMGPYVTWDLDGAAGSVAASETAGRSHRSDAAPQLVHDVAGMLFALADFEAVDPLAGVSSATERERLDVDAVDDWAVFRRSDGGAGESGFLVPTATGASAGDSDSDSDWDFDPYGDKENTPPPEPLPSAAPTSSASVGGSGALFAPSSPREMHLDDQPLPLPLLEPTPSTPTRAAAAAAAASATTATSSEQRRARMATPFAAPHPSFPVALDFVPRPEGGGARRPETAPSLHSEPTVSAGIAPSGGGGAAASYQSSGSVDDAEVVEMPSFDPSCLLASPMRASAGVPDGMDEGAQAALVPPYKQTSKLFDSGEEAGGNGGEGSARLDNLTPTKRPRRAYGTSDDCGSPTDRSPSPTRRVRSSGLLAGTAPTPRRPGVYGAAMASPCIRGGGRSRLAPAPGAGYLVTTAVSAAAGIGSESPMPKVGTASRTGGRHTAASKEFYRRRAEEERYRAVMSPFGFGLFAGAETPGGGGGSVRAPRTASRLAHDAGDATGPQPFSLAAFADDEAAQERAPLLPGDDDMGPMRRSVRSLSCVFETQTQGGSTLMVPCTNPAESEEAAREVEQVRRTELELLPFEERTVASPIVPPPPLLGSRRDGLGEDDCDEGGYFEPGAAREGGEVGRLPSFHFGSSAFAMTPQRQQLQHTRNDASVSRQQKRQLLDESSRSFPLAAMGDYATARGSSGGGGLQTAWSGQGVAGQGFVGAALHELLSLPSDHEGASGGPSQMVAPQQPPAMRAIAFPSLAPCTDGGLGALGPSDEQCTAEEELQYGAWLHRRRQQTLQQCWGASQRHPTPMGMRPAGPPPLPPSRPLGPTGLTSPKYFR